MLVGLGGHVLWQLCRDRMDLRCEPDGGLDVQAHSHADDCLSHAGADDQHAHGFRWRSLAVGLMHGMAGSAVLLVLAASQVADPVQGVGYVVLFGLGSMIGMGALSSLIAVPLVASAHLLTWINHSLQAVIGLVTIGIGTTRSAHFSFTQMPDQQSGSVWCTQPAVSSYSDPTINHNPGHGLSSQRADFW
jgi:hypothetical protein